MKGERILLSQGFNVLDHLDYLRLRLIRAILAFLLASVAGFWLAPWVVQSVLLRHVGLDGLVFLSPAEALLARLKLVFSIGFVLALPLILYQLWALFVPAMDQKQRRWTLLLIPGVYALFLLGIAFPVGAVLPTALRFLLGFGGEHLEHEISIANYISFVINFALPFGIIFELPVVVVGLTAPWHPAPGRARAQPQVHHFCHLCARCDLDAPRCGLPNHAGRTHHPLI